MMGIRKKIRIAFISLIILKALPLYAQQTFKYKADLPKVDSSGVYKIKLTPDMVAKCNQGLTDIRLLDQDGKFRAYVLSKNLFIDNPDHFVEFPEVKSNGPADSTTVFIAENKESLSIGQLWLTFKNTDVDRTMEISGSDDLKKWFAIRENVQLEKTRQSGQSEYEQMLNLPYSHYQYFKIKVNDKNKLPLKIVRCGIYFMNLASPGFSFLPKPGVGIKDTTAESHLYISFDQPYLINALTFPVKAPNYYTRHISIFDTDHDEKVCDTTLTIGTTYIYLSAKTRHLRVDISNGDDVPLTIGQIGAFQQEQYIVGYLEKGHSYSILTGDAEAKAGDYDLTFLKQKPYSALPVITHAPVNKNPAFVVPKPVVHKNFTLLLWTAIAVVLIALSFLTWRMVREIAAKGNG